MAGGRARRLAGADKPASRVGGRRLIDIALHAASRAGRIVVVGPERDLGDGVIQVQEEPPFAGPAAAVAAGFAALGPLDDDRNVAVLAADLPFLTAAAVAELAERRTSANAPAAFALDESERLQYLVGVWRADALRQALRTADASMKSMIPGGALGVPIAGIADVDTAADLAAARERAGPVGIVAASLHSISPVDPHSVDLGDLPADDLDRCLDSVLARPLAAAAEFPAFDTAAMDGYAVRGPGPWRVVGPAVRAGHDGDPLAEPGTAVPIATGARLPPGADRTIRVEETSTLDDGRVTETTDGRDDTRRRGSSWQTGDRLVATGAVVDAALLGTARAAGITRLDVRGPLRASLHTSGDEVGAAGSAAITDTASLPVHALLARLGVRVGRGEHLPDSPSSIADALGSRRRPGELVVIIGATGRGSADHLRTALDEAGATTLLDGLPVRPGGSLLLARLPDGGLLLGLGGNPVAAVAGTALTVPALRDALLAATAAPAERITVTNAVAVAHHELWRIVPVHPDGAGHWSANTVTSTAELRSLVGARALALLPPGGEGAVRRLV
nr:NTP transferase domain-containing protein [Gordonia araii]